MAFEIPNYAPEPTNSKLPLYAAVIMFYDKYGQEVKADTIFTHAENAIQAKFGVAASYTNEILKGRVKILEVGLAVGWFVQDEHGEQLAG